MRPFNLKVGDLRPYLRMQIISKDSKDPIPLTGAAVTFSLVSFNGARAVDNAVAVVEDGPNGIIRYEWAQGDTNIAGVYKAEFMVDAGFGNIFRVPQKGYVTVVIETALNTA